MVRSNVLYMLEALLRKNKMYANLSDVSIVFHCVHSFFFNEFKIEPRLTRVPFNNKICLKCNEEKCNLPDPP